MFTMRGLIVVIAVTALNSCWTANGESWVKQSAPALGARNHKQQAADPVKLLQQIADGNAALMNQLMVLEQQQRQQQAQLKHLNSQQDQMQEQYRESVNERQFLKQVISNLTSELANSNRVKLVPAGDDNEQAQNFEHQLKQRVRRELQAMACNVSAEIETVSNALQAVTHRLQQLDTQHGDLDQKLQSLNVVMANVEGNVTENLKAAIAQQLKQQDIQEQHRYRMLAVAIQDQNTVKQSDCQQPSNDSQTFSQHDQPPSMVRRSFALPNRNRRLVSATLNTTLPRTNCVWGAAELHNELYVGRAMTQNFEIYDIATWTLQRRITISGLGCINDMISCPSCDVLYVVDLCNRLIHVVDEHGVRVQWPVVDRPLAVSVTPERNILITFENKTYIREYTSQGELVFEISLQSDIDPPHHAVKLANNRYAIAQGQQGQAGLHRVCVVNAEGIVQQSFGAEKGTGFNQLNVPTRLAVINEHLMLVLDLVNDRVTLLNSTSLVKVREVVSMRSPTEYMVRLSLSPSANQLYIPQNHFENGGCSKGHIKIFNLRWI